MDCQGCLLLYNLYVKEMLVLYEDSSFREKYEHSHSELHELGLKFSVVNFTNFTEWVILANYCKDFGIYKPFSFLLSHSV